VIAGPLYDQEGMILADCDLRRVLHAKRVFDALGHYSAEAALGTGAAAAPAPVPPRAAEERFSSPLQANAHAADGAESPSGGAARSSETVT
jgi:hypothetical protein